MIELPQTPFSVADFIEILNTVIHTLEVKIIGEVTSVKISTKGHVYFTLKDKDKNAVLDCVMWKGVYDLNNVDLVNGMEVIVHGNPDVYANWGKLSFQAKVIERVGEGALKEAYDKLKLQLTQDGLFAPERKRPLPPFPTKIGIITSKQGAVIHDFNNNIGRHGFQITFIDSRVEGQECLPDLLRAITAMKQQPIEVLVIMRGGGSLQSLAAFDNENIVREIAAFPVPVIAAIGHHTDVTLMALAADAEVSTPTAAANLLNSAWQEGREALLEDTYTILNGYSSQLQKVDRSLTDWKDLIFANYEQIIKVFTETQSRIKQQMLAFQIQLAGIEKSLTLYAISRAFTYALETNTNQIAHWEKIINLNNPERLLKKGFSILQTNGKIVRSIQNVVIGSVIEAMIADGKITMSAITIQKDKDYEKTN